jgi:hypothetical protein
MGGRPTVLRVADVTPVWIDLQPVVGFVLKCFAVIEEVAVTSGSAASGIGSIFGASRV